MNIDYSNMPMGANKMSFTLRYLMNVVRTWIYFHVVYRQVEYHGFVRVMKGTSFAPGIKVRLGNNVQFGDYSNVATNLTVGNNVLFAGRVCFVGRYDHQFSECGKTIWASEHEQKGTTIIDDDVWLGHRVTVVGPVHIGAGSIVAAGAVVTKDIPPCEVWGGVPARKIRNRFSTAEEKSIHLQYLKENAKDSH